MRVFPHIVSQMGQSVPNEASTLHLPATPSPDVHPVSPILLISTVLFVILFFELVCKHTLLGYITFPAHPATNKLLHVVQKWSQKSGSTDIDTRQSKTILVSCGPGLYSVNDLTVINQILNPPDKVQDSEFNSRLLPKPRYKPTLFLNLTRADEAEWRKSRLPEGPVERSAKGQYTLFEPSVDATVHCFCKQLDKAFAETGAVCRLSEKLQSFAFDAVSTIVDTKNIGLLDTGASIKSAAASNYVNAARIPHWAIADDLTVSPGAEALGVFLKTLVLNLFQEPECLGRLMAEFNLARQSWELDNFPTWQQVRVLPYLDACVKETGRLHPPFSLRLDRIVPYEGTTLFGNPLKGGGIVGVNAPVVHQSKSLFGDDADVWNPCRWFCEEDEQLAMEQNLLTFGFSNSACPGRIITELVLYKLIPTLLQRYEICLIHSSYQESSSNSWQAPKIVLDVSITRRDESEKCISSEHCPERKNDIEKCVRLAVAE